MTDVLVRLDGEAVVLHGHEHAPGAGVPYGVVRAAMPERQLERGEVQREAEQLVAETDAEERHAAEELADARNRPVEHRRIARPVPDQHCAWLELEDRVRVPVAGDDGHLEAGLGEPPRNRPLTAEIEECEPRARADEVRLLGADAAVERPPVDRRLRERTSV